ncbi:uncharacterized protein A4U43_C03F20580 [Asparagus officinalis]|uniref:Expansin n=1 Tax=Asparagus officinalis TaxID=4686 RepID=A0A5P1FGT9_ASPOF|nr:uncharacterized protein A4U43_C03F20580 [Asparagus officinalis]
MTSRSVSRDDVQKEPAAMATSSSLENPPPSTASSQRPHLRRLLPDPGHRETPSTAQHRHPPSPPPTSARRTHPNPATTAEPPTQALRPLHAHVHQNRQRLPRGHRARAIQKSSLHQNRRDEVTGVSVKGSKGGAWYAMTRNWGQNWQTGEQLLGQSLSFRVTASDGRTVESVNVVPANWQFGQNFEGKQF